MLRRETRVEYIKSRMTGRVLDIGATNATLHRELLQDCRGCQVFGLDVRFPAAAFPLFILADAQSLPFRDEVFDTIIAGELIEHLPVPRQFLSESYRVLRSGGRLLITTPNMKSYVNRVFKASFHTNHISLMDAEELLSYLRTSGLHVEDFFCLPYYYEATPGVKPFFRYFFWLRRSLHHVMPQSLQENMIALAGKQGDHRG